MIYVGSPRRIRAPRRPLTTSSSNAARPPWSDSETPHPVAQRLIRALRGRLALTVAKRRRRTVDYKYVYSNDDNPCRYEDA